METIDYKGYTIKVEQDMDASNPRTEWDNLGTMVCAHGSYTLGDEQHNPDGARNWRENMAHYFADKAGVEADFYMEEKEIDKIWKWINVNVYWLPLSLYDHSGITMSVGRLSGWDSGEVGFIFITKETIRKEFGFKNVTKKRAAKIYEYLTSEVKTYDDYLTGSVYGFSIEDRDGEQIDSCRGFYGYNHEKSGLLDMAKPVIDADIEKRMVGHIQAAIAQVHTDHASYAYGANI